MLTMSQSNVDHGLMSPFVDPLHQEWDRVLPFAAHAYNACAKASTRISPFRALYRVDEDLLSVHTYNYELIPIP